MDTDRSKINSVETENITYAIKFSDGIYKLRKEFEYLEFRADNFNIKINKFPDIELKFMLKRSFNIQYYF